MNVTQAIVRLMETYRPEETVTTRVTDKKTTARTERRATVIQRRPNADAPATIAELVDAFISSTGVQFALRDGETPVGHAFAQAERLGKIVIKRDKNGATGSDNDIPRAAWLAQDAPVRKRKAKGDKAREQHERRLAVLASLGLAPTEADQERAAQFAQQDAEDQNVDDRTPDEDESEDEDDDFSAAPTENNAGGGGRRR